MFDLRRFYPLLIVVVMAQISSLGLAQQPRNTNVVPMSLEQYTNFALQQGLRSKTAEESLASNRWGWIAARRNLTWPTLSAAASQSKTYADDDLGTETDINDQDAAIALKQPLLTGADVSVVGNWSRMRTEEDELGLVTASHERHLPAWTANFTQPIFLFVRNPDLRTRRLAGMEWENDQDAYWSERLDIEFEARKQYYDLLLQAETTAVERKKYESAAIVNDVTRALVRAGKLPEVELVRADISSKSDQRKIQNSESNLEKAMNTAKDLISLGNERTIQPTSKLTYAPFNVPLDAILKAAIENNPALQTARRGVDFAKISLQETMEGNRPLLNTSGSYALTQDRSDPTLPIDPYTWTLTMGVEWKFFDASQTKLKTIQSDLALKTAKRNFENEQRQLEVSVRNAYLEIKRVEDQITDFGPQRDSAERNVRAIRLQYKNGLTRLTDVFDAENQLRELELEYLGLLVDFNTARDGLKVLVGADLDDVIRGQAK